MSDQTTPPPAEEVIPLPPPVESPPEVPAPDPFVEETLSRFDAIEKKLIGYRQGQITALSPLSVALGGSDVSYTSVNALDSSALAVGTTVACLMLGTDLLILGAISSSPKGGVPTGGIIMAGTTTAPTGYLECDGSSQLRASFPELFAIIGTTFGSADGTHFNVPDLKGRVPMGRGTGSGLTARTIGTKTGAETVALATAELPSHTHPGTSHTHTAGTLAMSTDGSHTHTANQPSTNATVQTGGGSSVSGAMSSANTGSNGSHTHTMSGSTGGGGTAASGSTGSGTAHANVQPSTVVAFFIKT